jgi:stringent starvation protein B
MSTQTLPPKKEVALALLERSSVHVHLDPRAAGVVVPAWFKKQPQLVLQIGLNMPVPIPDLRLDEVGMSCTLSFNRAPFYCVVPWPSVYAMVGDDGRGMVWPENVPPEVAQQAKEPAAARKPTVVRRERLGAPPAPAPAPAEDAARAADGRGRDGAAKATKPRKRPRIVTDPAPEARGALVAVPPAHNAHNHRGDGPKRGPVAVPEPAPVLAQVPPPAAGSPKPAQRRPTTNGAPRQKRELPPYLRVVK